MKEESEKNYRTDFPKITICLNSMHSLDKLRREYPEFVAYVTIHDIEQIIFAVLSL